MPINKTTETAENQVGQTIYSCSAEGCGRESKYKEDLNQFVLNPSIHALITRYKDPYTSDGAVILCDTHAVEVTHVLRSIGMELDDEVLDMFVPPEVPDSDFENGGESSE